MRASNSSDRLEWVVQLFAEQFELTPTGWTYRYKHKGAPIKVSTDERAHFIDDFRFGLRLLSWACVIAALVALAALMGYTIREDIDLEDAWIWATLAAVALPYYLGFQYLVATPRRALATRQAVGPARSKEEMRHLWAAKTSWRQLVVALAGTAALIWSQALGHNLLEGWHRLWLVFGAGMLLGVGWSASNKLRSGSQD